jgi:hypothetical protein
MPLKIPREDVPAIVSICELSEETTEQLVSALASSPIASESAKLATDIAPRVPSVPIEDLTRIVDVLYSLYHVREFSEVNPERFLDDVIDGIVESGLCSNSPERPDQSARIRSRFQALLNIATLNTLSKAVGLQRDGERLYCEAKIISDIRPIFTDDASSRPVAAVITHTLKLSYHEGGGHKIFYVVLDGPDLESFQAIIERALEKDGTLRNLLDEAKVPELGM